MRDFLPAVNLLLAMDTRRLRITLALWGDLGSLGNDQAGAGALGVIARIKRVRDIACGGATTCQGRHDDTVGQRHVAKR